MRDQPRTVFTFTSAAFNTTEPKDYCINPGCFGEDLANWLIQELRARGIQTDDEPGQEDFGWYFNFTLDGAEYSFVLGYRPGDEDTAGSWIGWLERNCGLLVSLLGGRNRGSPRPAAELIHSVFTSSEQVRAERWHYRADFDAGREDRSRTEP